MGLLVIGLGAWMLWLQRELLALAMGEPSAARTVPAALGGATEPALAGDPEHDHHHAHEHHHHHGRG